MAKTINKEALAASVAQAATTPQTTEPQAEATPQPGTPEPAPQEAPAPTKAPRKPLYGRAAELLVKKRERDAQRAKEERQRDAEENIHFLYCPRNREHHAAYLTGPYEGAIRPDQWFSLVKPETTHIWTRDHIPCQECLLSGDSRPWAPHLTPKRDVEGNVTFYVMVKREYVLGSCSREEFERRAGEINESVGEEVV